MSHEIHSTDIYGTYNERCPDCNNPWLEAVVKIVKLHPAREALNGARYCGNGCGGWPCQEIEAIGQETYIEAVRIIRMRGGSYSDFLAWAMEDARKKGENDNRGVEE